MPKAQPMEEDEPELDISQMLPEPTGFMAFAGSGKRFVCFLRLKNILKLTVLS